MHDSLKCQIGRRTFQIVARRGSSLAIATLRARRAMAHVVLEELACSYEM